jgi:long-chain fatty acid transport protein
MKKLLSLVVIILMSGSSSMATDGYFSYGYGTHYKGFAGGGIALYRSSLMGANNPAGLVFLGKQYDVGIGFFMPFRKYTVTGNPSGFPGTFPLAPGTVESGSEFFVIPNIGANWMLNENSSLGLSIYGNGGMNTDYPAASFNGSDPAGVDLSQLFANLSYARKLNEKHALGVSGVLAYQRFEAVGLEAFAGFSADPNALTNNEHDNSTGFGFKAGYLGHFGDNLQVGASYQSTIWMGEFDNYAGLYAEQGDFDIPSNFTVGFAYDISDKVIVLADYKRINYSEVNSVSNPFDINKFPLGGENAPGFGWNDINVYKVGFEFKATENWTFRTGYSRGDNPIESSEVLFNILAPAVIENHISVGFTRLLGDNSLSFAATYAPNSSVSGPNPLEAPDQQNIKLEMSQLDFEFTYSF